MTSDRRTTSRILGAIGLLAGVALGLVRYFNGEPVDIVGGIGLGAVGALPGALALRGRRQTLIAAGILAIAGSVIAMSGVTLPMLPYGLVCIFAGLRLPEAEGDVTRIARLGAAVVLGVAAAFALFAHESVRCTRKTVYPDSVVYERDPETERTSTSNSGSSTSGPLPPGAVEQSQTCGDAVEVWEAIVSLTLVASAVIVSAPIRDNRSLVA